MKKFLIITALITIFALVVGIVSFLVSDLRSVVNYLEKPAKKIMENINKYPIYDTLNELAKDILRFVENLIENIRAIQFRFV